MFKKKKQCFDYHKTETPPEPTLSSDALVVVWNKDKMQFCEIFYNSRAGAYVYRGYGLFYDEFYTGYYWGMMDDGFASFFDTFERAKQAAEDFLDGK